jgi:hypothetical protein
MSAKQRWKTRCHALAAATNSAGLPIALRAVRLILGPAADFQRQRAFFSLMAALARTNNDVNAIKTLGMVPEIVINHYLTDNDAWFLQTNAPNGLISYQRRPLELQDDSDFDTEITSIKRRSVTALAGADPRAMFGNPGA